MRRYAATAVALMAVVALAYWCATPGSSANLPLQCSLPPAFLDSHSPDARVVTPDQQNPATPPNAAPMLQEMSDVTGEDDTLYALLHANLLDEAFSKEVASKLASVIRAGMAQSFDAFTPLKPDCPYSITLDQNGNFLRATLEMDPSNVFHAAWDGDGVKAWKEDVVLDFKEEVVQFRLTGSFTDSLLHIGDGAELARELTKVFRWDIDFRTESKRGDVCRVLVERRYADDRPSGYRRILCAVYEGKRTGRKTAVLFNGEYWNEEGVELKKDFLRSPLTQIRVTSRYGRRFHPVLRVWRKHNGVDYGAAKGTPVMSIANGVVTFAGWSNGYGNYVCVKHDNGYESRYGHLDRMFVRKGQRVKQQQRMGNVGMTGIATGPHLDFQLLKSGKHVNPQSEKMVRSARAVPGGLKHRFTTVSRERQLSLKKTLVSSETVAQRVAEVR